MSSQIQKPLKDLTEPEVNYLLESLNLDNYIKVFKQNKVDGRTLQNCHFLEDVKQLGITINAKARVLLVEIEKLRTSGISVEHSNKVWSDRVIIYVAIFFIITMLRTNQYYNIAIVLRMKMMILACLLLSPLLGTIPFQHQYRYD